MSLVLTGVLLLTAVAVGTWWWRGEQREVVRAATGYADTVAASIEGGRLPPELAVADREAAQEGLDVLLGGMGSLEHEVEVTGVTVDRRAGTGEVELVHRWTVRPGEDPWTYRTTMPLERAGDSWRGRWSSDVVVAGVGEGERIRAVRLDAERADVLGAGGEPLVRMRDVVRVGIDRSLVPDEAEAGRSAERLAALLDVDPARFVAEVTGAGPRAFVAAITYRVDAPELAAALPELGAIEGAVGVDDELPLAPTSSFARPILGAAGEATAEVIEESQGRVRAGDLVGLSGVQAAYDETLAGEPGYVVEAVDLATEEARPLHEVAARDGEPVQLTLSVPHQDAAEAVLAQVEPASAVVAIRPSDGHVLAAASGPGSQGYSTATLGQYAPGSTFKAVSALALVRAGLTGQSEVDCPQTVVVDGRAFTNFDDYPASALGRVSLRTAFANSCNTALMQERDRLEPSSLPDAATALGLTADPVTGVPAALGSVPEPDSEVEGAAAMIGQGRVLSTPLGMATVAASLQRGAAVRPLLVLDGDVEPPSPGPALSDEEHRQLLDMLRAVVTEGGATFLADVPGEPVAAKTGTAEFGEPGAGGELATHAWMIGIQGDLAVAVFVERGAGGSRVAGPVLEDFLTRLAASPPVVPAGP